VSVADAGRGWYHVAAPHGPQPDAPLDPKGRPVPAIVSKLAAVAAATLAGVAARRAAELGWKLATGEEPPSTRDHDIEDDAELRDVLLWTGLLVGTVLLARKFAVSRTRALMEDEDDD
jgi:hypothetical protein